MSDLVQRLRAADPISHQRIAGSTILADAAARIEQLEALLKEIQAYSVGEPRPRHTWYYDRIEEALNQQIRDDP